MKTEDYWTSLTTAQREKVAKAAGTNLAYLYQVCFGFRNASPALAKRLERHTGVPRGTWRPDIWGLPMQYRGTK